MNLPTATVYGISCALFLFLWVLLRKKYTRLGPLLYVVLAVTLIYGLAFPNVLAMEDRLVPWKFDEILYRLDRAMGLSILATSRATPPWLYLAFVIIYKSLLWAVTIWAGIHLVKPWGRFRELVSTFTVGYIVASIGYLIVPGIGPTLALKHIHEHGPCSELLLSGLPNAMPSMHVASALFLVLFAGPNRWMRAVSLLYLIGTAGGTVLAGEHYFIDWIVAIPLACFAERIVTGYRSAAALYGAAMLSWLLLIHFAGAALTHHGSLLWAMVTLTVMSGVYAVRRVWIPTESEACRAAHGVPPQLSDEGVVAPLNRIYG